MTGKTRIVIAVASAFGCTAAAHAASNHQANWIAAGDEQYPPMVMFEGNDADTVATITTPDAENVGAGLSNAASAIAGTIAHDQMADQALDCERGEFTKRMGCSRR